MARPVLVPAALADRPLRVGVLVDLLWSPTAGGHVKTWERLARAALSAPEAVELTVHFQGTTASRHTLGSALREIPTWRQVLLQDLLPVWRRAAGS